jgi:hypothetical protein
MSVRASWCLYVQCWGAIHVQQTFDVRSKSCHIHSYVHTRTHIQQFHSSTVLWKQPRETHALTEAMKARQKCRLTGPTTGCWTNQAACIEEKQSDRQTAVRYTQQSKQTTYLHAHTHAHTVCMIVCMFVWGSRANQPHTRHHRSSRVCQWSLHVVRTTVTTIVNIQHAMIQKLSLSARVCWQLSCMLIQVDKQRTDTVIHISEAYIRLCFHRKKRKEISTHACTSTCACMCPPQLNHISRVCECALQVRVCVLLLFR